MKFIQHRVNSIEGAANIDKAYGAEIDIRSNIMNPDELVVTHDPWSAGPTLESWLKAYIGSGPHEAPLILNTKEDGLEDRIISLIEDHKIEDYFFLDTSMPTLVKQVLKLNRKKFALRLSRYEPLICLEAFMGKSEWVWLDCFDGVPVKETVAAEAAKHFKICLVSPELQGVKATGIEAFKPLLSHIAAICTKNIEAWKINLS